MNPFVITCAITGAETTKAQQPALPITPAEQAMAAALGHLVALLESELGKHTHWGVAGVGRFQLPLAIQALPLGGHVRVGFEDNIYSAKGVLAKSNAELVARVAGLARDSGRVVATPKQAREMLGLYAGTTFSWIDSRPGRR